MWVNDVCQLNEVTKSLLLLQRLKGSILRRGIPRWYCRSFRKYHRSKIETLSLNMSFKARLRLPTFAQISHTHTPIHSTSRRTFTTTANKMAAMSPEEVSQIIAELSKHEGGPSKGELRSRTSRQRLSTCKLIHPRFYRCSIAIRSH